MSRNLHPLIFALLIIFSLGSCKKNHEIALLQDAPPTAEINFPAGPTEFLIDSDASQINWKGSKPTGFHTGTIKVKTGIFKVNNNTIENGQVVIDMTSIKDTDLEGEWREKLESHLKGTVEGREGDFFNVNKYPEATFVISGMNTVNGKTNLQGNLTMKGITKAVEIPVSYSVSGNSLQLSSDTFIIDRTQWGINYMSKSIFDGLGDKFVSDDIELKLNIKATKA